MADCDKEFCGEHSPAMIQLGTVLGAVGTMKDTMVTMAAQVAAIHDKMQKDAEDDTKEKVANAKFQGKVIGGVLAVSGLAAIFGAVGGYLRDWVKLLFHG